MDAIVNDAKIATFDKRPGDMTLEVSLNVLFISLKQLTECLIILLGSPNQILGFLYFFYFL